MAKAEIYTVSKINQLIKENLEVNFGNIWIEGEISNLRIPSTGHLYLTLKDELAQIQAVIFKTQRKGIRFDIKDGLSVIANGRITVYEARGIYQIIIDYIEPKGIGALQLAFEQLKAKLSQEGLFDERFKKKLPLLPKKIGIITSPTGAAIRDILQVINRRFANIHILIYPVKVQGDEAPKEIVQAIEELNKFTDIDVLILARGGGSIEDLWAFNEEIVARALFSSRIPVISAIGHEIDYTISDFVADFRAPTPSAAAELVISSKEEIQKHLDFLHRRLEDLFFSKIKYLKKSLEMLTSLCQAYSPLGAVRNLYQRIDDLISKLEKKTLAIITGKKEALILARGNILSQRPTHRILAFNEILKSTRHRLQVSAKNSLVNYKKEYSNSAGILSFLNPYSQLERGYSICQKPEGVVIKSILQVKSGEPLNVRVTDGEILCQVNAQKKI